MCSKSEAFGRVTVEYMANKLITIASNTGASPEIIMKNTGFLYKQGNYRNLANIIKKIYYMDNDEKNKIINNAYNLVKDNFSDVCNAKNVYNLYLKILKIERN